ncbi:MAG: TM2 domain-containing protein [Rikenellaceae bacterium]
MYCKNCGKEINNRAVICVHCGCSVAPNGGHGTNQGVIVLLLCLFLGTLGVHRFYVGKIWTGLLMLVTFGCFGILYVIDLIMIILGEFTDSQGNKIRL